MTTRERAYLLVDATCRALERTWSRDRSAVQQRTQHVLRVLSRIYLRREILRAAYDS